MSTDSDNEYSVAVPKDEPVVPTVNISNGDYKGWSPGPELKLNKPRVGEHQHFEVDGHLQKRFVVLSSLHYLRSEDGPSTDPTASQYVVLGLKPGYSDYRIITLNMHWTVKQEDKYSQLGDALVRYNNICAESAEVKL